MHGRADLTDRCLRGVFGCTAWRDLQCIVVDDASPVHYEAPTAFRERVEVVRLEENVGFGGACMAGARSARGRFVVFLNNDVDVTPGWADALLQVTQLPGVAAVGPRIVYPDGALQEAGGIVWQDARAWTRGDHEDPTRSQFGMIRDVDFVSGAVMLVDRQLFDGVGGFDAAFGRGYYEDVDLCFRFRAQGRRVVYTPFSTVVHARSQSFDGLEARATPDTGKDALMQRNRRVFFERWRAELDGRYEHGTRDGLFGGRRTERLRVLVVDWNVPQADREAGGLRMRDICESLVREGCLVTMFPLDGQCREPYTTELRTAGVEVRCAAGPIDDLMRERPDAYDLVVSSRPDITEHVLPAIRRWQPLATVAYDAVDLHFVREARQRTVEGRTSTRLEDAAVEREHRMLRRCDLVTAVSDDEAAVIRSIAPDQRIVVLPIVHDVIDVRAPFAGRGGVLFVGGMRHAPNLDGIHWYLDEVRPRLRDRDAATTVIVGPDPPEGLRARGDGDVRVEGFVPDLDPYLRRAKVVVCPVRFGAGVKGKVLQAMAHGVPVVTTSIGAEGTGLVDGVHALVRDDPSGFADAVDLLATDEGLWQRLADASHALARELVAPERLRARVHELVTMVSREPAATARWRP